ncbi:hypothetical protein Tco_0997322, partial [Tanacetum coccineum]
TSMDLRMDGSCAEELCTAGTKVNTARLVNDVKEINATVDSKAVIVTEASIRSSLLFNDVDGTACLTNETIFQNLSLMGYEDELNKLSFQKALFSPQCEPLNDVYATPAHTQKVFTNMSRKGLKFSRKIAPLFPNMLPQSVVDEGEGIFILCTNLSNRVLTLETAKDAQAVEIIKLKKRITKLKQKSEPVISHYRAWLKSVQRLSMKKRFGKKESVSKQGRKTAKLESTLDDSIVFDDLDADHGMDYMETKEAVDEGKKSNETGEVKLNADTEEVVEEEKDTEELVNKGRLCKEIEELNVTHDTEVLEKGGSNEEPVSDLQSERVTIKEVKESDRPERSILTLKPLPLIDPKDKVLKEELAEWKRKSRKDIRQEKHLDERMIDKMNKKAAGMTEEEVLEELDSTKVEVKQEGHIKSTKKRSGRRLKMKATKRSKRQKTNSDLKEEKQLKAFLKIVPDEEEEVDYEVLDKRYPIVDWESKFYHTDRYGKPHNYYKVIRSNGSSRWIKTFSEMVTRLDRMILRSYDDLWKNQEKWILKKWNFYENCGVHILMLEDSTEFYMLAERRYPLTTETLERMLALRILAESESEAVFDLLRFIQKQINESRSHDGGEEDLHQELANLEANGFCKKLASLKQTALGKDISNPLIVDSLLKTIWLSMHCIIAMKHWLFQSKRLLTKVQDPFSKGSNKFDMKELGPARKILGIEIVRDRGSLLYLMVCTSPDITYAVSIVSRYLANPDYAKDPDKGRSITGEIIESKEIKVAKTGTKDNAADAFTKVVPGLKFKYCMEILGVGIN